MISFEQEIKAFFLERQIPLADHSDSYEKLDFGFGDRTKKRYFSLDAKEKRQRYSMGNWPDAGIPEEHLFIMDDLAARKILAYAPNSGMIIRDNLRRRYFLFLVVDLFLMPKVRVNRSIHKTKKTKKGKWLMDLRNGRSFSTLDKAVQAIDTYLDNRKDIFVKILECYGNYEGETIGKGGIIRRPDHWVVDVFETR